MEIPIKMDDWEVPLFSETPMFQIRRGTEIFTQKIFGCVLPKKNVSLCIVLYASRCFLAQMFRVLFLQQLTFSTNLWFGRCR